MYGTPGALTTDPKDEIKLEIDTEKEWEPGEAHGVWFNRGAIASQTFAEEFGNSRPERTSTIPTTRRSRGCRAACSKPA